MPTKKPSSHDADELRPEYALAVLDPGVRGKYFERASTGTNIIRLDPDVAAAFPTSESVNTALRALLGVAEATVQRRSAPARRKR